MFGAMHTSEKPFRSSLRLPLEPPQIAYAESTGECRRSMLMHHFGERTFGPEQCARTCDVCQQLAAGGKQVRGPPARAGFLRCMGAFAPTYSSRSRRPLYGMHFATHQQAWGKDAPAHLACLAPRGARLSLRYTPRRSRPT